MKTKMATPKRSSRKQNLSDDTNIKDQKSLLLVSLRHGPIDTLRARCELNILHPGGRINELRAAGHKIFTHRITLIDEHGRQHRSIALYSLTKLAGRSGARVNEVILAPARYTRLEG